jgi:fucose 4-O-acetylase-like acetyltransferase
MQTAVQTGEPLRPSASPRLFFLDNLRVFLAILVIVHHTAITYGASGSWYYVEPGGNPVVSSLLTLLVAINQFYFMGLFFFISGYFTPGAMERKGSLVFLKDKLIRLGIPLVVFSWLIDPFMKCLVNMGLNLNSPAFWEFYRTRLFDLSNLEPGPLWFVLALLIFNMIHIIIRFTGKFISHPKPDRVRMFTGIGSLVFAVFLGAVTFLVRLEFPIMKVVCHFQIAYFPQYILLYILGVMAYRGQWLPKIPVKLSKYWLIGIVAIILIMPGIMIFGAGPDGNIYAFFGGFTWQSAVNGFTEGFLCTGISISLLVLFRERLNISGRFSRALGKNTYPVYIIHGLVIILLSLTIKNQLLHPFVKFALVSVGGSVFSFGVGHYVIRRIPLVGKIFN